MSMHDTVKVRSRMVRFAALLCGAAALLGAAQGAAGAEDFRPDAVMLRHPDVSATHIVFSYANNLWQAPREGGVATPLVSPNGPVTYPRYSPDGKTIAFIGNYEGNRDIYTIPSEGGPAHRVTHHPGVETLNDWTPDGKRLLFFTSGLAGYGRLDQLFFIDAKGGMYEKLPVPYGARGAISPDGDWLAYTFFTRDYRTWKRYRGGWATDIWLFNLKTFESKQITDWEGTDTQPMWHGTTVYYLSDAGPEHRWNLWSYDTRTGQRRQITTFNNFDCKWASMGPGPRGRGEVVLQNGSSLHLVDLGSGRTTRVDVRIPGDRPQVRARRVDFSANIAGMSLSPSGKRIAVEARGDIWSLPATEGATLPLTGTSGAAERNPIWSPDGRWIAYLSDEAGEYDVYVRAADGTGSARRLTAFEDRFRTLISWSPDSRWVLMTDNAGDVWLVDAGAEGAIEGTGAKKIVGDAWSFGRGVSPSAATSWSHDSNWIAICLGNRNMHYSLWMYNIATEELTRITEPMFHVSSPAFDRKGEYLYLLSNRRFQPEYNDLPNDTTWVYRNSTVVLTVPLRPGIKSPFLAKNDEQEALGEEAKKKDDEKKNEKNGGDEDGEKAKPALEIALDGFEARAMELPIPAGSYRSLSVNDKNHLLFLQRNEEGSDLKIYDMHADKPEVKTVLDGVRGYTLSADGKKALVLKGSQRAVIDAAAGQKIEKAAPTDAMVGWVMPREEWRQMYMDAWRLTRDFFYVPGMHGVDWARMRDRYAKVLEDCTHRDDVTFVIQELISELNVGHVYYRPGSLDDEPREGVGLLGCDFALENGAYRIKRIVQGAAWDTDARSPLAAEGLDVREGDYLLAVNGVPVDVSRDPWAAFVGLADRTVSLTVSENPVMDDDARRVVVRTLSSESNLRFRDWIESNRRYVDERSGGKVGYIYVQNTQVAGQSDLVRQFFGQVHKPALLIDDRWNGGGQIPTRFIELLNRPRTNYWARRHGDDWPWPPDSHQGPKAMLINGLSASGGDMFPALFKQFGLGPLVGMRTWGGLVGISGNPQLIDGTGLNIPTFGYYRTDGTWGIEGHGVDPDLRVVDDPGIMATGRDPQIDAAVEYLLEELRRNPYTPPARPREPDRSGFGIADEDK